ncbi:MAG TPA: Gfo/Idh/MocA family oxidoreductase [Chloroflexota bacterium]|nr:Gfo/Idh/MocA family oxidoreductase [Chloroflexota bacterium]
MSGEKVNVGLIGLGLISRVHQRGYLEIPDKATIVAVCDINQDVVERTAAALGCAAYTEYHALLADPRIDAVDITLPHNLHYAVVKSALEHGKHVLVEKPMAATAAECRELIELARAASVTFTVAENTRFVTAYLAAEALLQAGTLGAPRLIRTLISGSEVERLSNPTLWKGRRDGTVGGTILDAGPHSFYLLKWLFGEIATVRAFQAQLVPESEVEDHAVVAGTLRTGALFTTEYTFTAEIPWGERCEIYGSTGSLIIDQLCNPPALHYRGGQDYQGEALAGVPYDPRGWKGTSIAEGVKDFVGAILEHRPPAVDPLDGYYTLKVVEHAYASVALAGQSVSL